MNCKRCGKETNTGIEHGEGIPTFKILIILCKDCSEDWRDIYNESGIMRLKDEEYRKAYYKLFWDWLHNSIEHVQFS